MKRATIPARGRPEEDILTDLASFCRHDPDYRHGRTWSLVYYLDEDHERFINRAYAFYSSGAYAAAWAAIQKIGRQGYMRLAEKTMRTADFLKQGIGAG